MKINEEVIEEAIEAVRVWPYETSHESHALGRVARAFAEFIAANFVESGRHAHSPIEKQAIEFLRRTER